MKSHMFFDVAEDKPIEVRLGTDNPDNWRVAVLIRGEAKQGLSKMDCVAIAKYIKQIVDANRSKMKELLSVKEGQEVEECTDL
jgi:hypothetical protein